MSDMYGSRKKLTKDNAISQQVLQDVLAALMPGVKVDSGACRILNTNRNIARTLFQIRLGLGAHEREIFVKVFDDPRKTLQKRITLAEAENRFHQYAQQRFSAFPSLQVPPLVGPFPARPVVVVEKVNGIQLSHLLRKAVWMSSFIDDSGIEKTLRRVGEWLRVFHDGYDPVLRPIIPETVLESVLREFDRLPAPPYNAVLRSEVEKFCFRSLERSTVRELPVAPQHGDFLPHNILIDGDKVYGLDFNSVRMDADGLEDLSHFIAYLELFRKLPICSPRVVKRWQASFLGGYGQSGWDDALLGVFVLRSVLAILNESIRYKTWARGFISRYVARKLWTLDGELENGLFTAGKILSRRS